MKVLGIIQARLASTRLPEKIFLKLEGKKVIEHVINRVQAAQLVDDILVATTSKKIDIKVVNLCSSIGIKCFSGSEEDVLDRYYQSAKSFKPEHIVRVTADCPLIDPEIIDSVIDLHLKKKADYTSNVISGRFPDGEDVEVFTFNTLYRAWHDARLFSEREHVTPYMKKNSDIFKIGSLDCNRDLSGKRWTLDNPEDYEFIKIIYRNLYPENHLFGMKEIIEFINNNPDIENINKWIERNEGYKKSLKKDNSRGVS
jgi:spore coat polysaccharide biosynthesis protein SpsF (cytidylyltransferase family)